MDIFWTHFGFGHILDTLWTRFGHFSRISVENVSEHTLFTSPQYPAITACIYKIADTVEGEEMFPQELKRDVLSKNPNVGVYFYKRSENG